MQAKDISDLEILSQLSSLESRPRFKWLPHLPPKVLLAKMKSLIKRGLVSGCACGCRGDFLLTVSGLAKWLELDHPRFK